MRWASMTAAVIALCATTAAHAQTPREEAVEGLLRVADMALLTVEMCHNTLSDAEKAAARLRVLDTVSRVALPREAAMAWLRQMMEDAEMARGEDDIMECRQSLEDALREMETEAERVRASG